MTFEIYGPDPTILDKSGRKPHVLIIGAGLAGLTLGIMLQKSGIPFDIFEKSPEAGAVGGHNSSERKSFVPHKYAQSSKTSASSTNTSTTPIPAHPSTSSTKTANLIFNSISNSTMTSRVAREG
ncbi:hypothetical protein BGZ88_012386 [Linnemannia elongata]|nr:hypothetical protein BGZ88_012386 [Linnemannia elongata]